MGSHLTNFAQKKQKNPFEDALSRNDSGGYNVNVGKVIERVGATGSTNREVNDFANALGTGEVALEDVLSYSKDYSKEAQGDAGGNVTSTWSPISGMGKDLLSSAQDAFNIREEGERTAASIRQKGRDDARQSAFGVELGTAQRRAQALSEDNALDESEAVADVVLGSNVEEAEGEPSAGGRGRARRRAAYTPSLRL